MKGFKDDEKRKLAIITGIFLGNGFCSAKVLSSIFEEHLVKDGMFYINLRIASAQQTKEINRWFTRCYSFFCHTYMYQSKSLFGSSIEFHFSDLLLVLSVQQLVC